MKGTWQTTSGGDPLTTVALVIAAGAAAVTLGPAAAAVAGALEVALLVAGGVLAVTVAAGVVLVVYRVRHPPAPLALPRLHPPAVAPPRPQEIEGPQVHLHFHGMSPEAVAAALRDARIGE